jgi:hypothetical protein
MQDQRTDWLEMQPGDFDTEAPPVQLALIGEPDPIGTPDMFGGSDDDDR